MEHAGVPSRGWCGGRRPVTDRDLGSTFLRGLRVVEIGSELGEYCAKLLAGLGADVVRVEPPGGEESRGYGPFARDAPHPERSLHFWHYNQGKRSAVLDLDTVDGQRRFGELIEAADILVDSRPRGYLESRNLGADALAARNKRLIQMRISPFGDDGPYADYQGGDLVHLALGGVVMNCGYDPNPEGFYDTPPVAPQMWQAYQITGELAVIAILGALLWRLRCGLGQVLSTSVHQSVSQSTENDVPNWIFLRQTHRRLTCRHSSVAMSEPVLAMTKDGRYLYPYNTYLKGTLDSWPGTVDLLDKYGFAADLIDTAKWDGESHMTPFAAARIADQVRRLVQRTRYGTDLWREAQDRGLAWAPVRKPEENAQDEHWRSRGAITRIEHPELDDAFDYVGSKWFSPDVSWGPATRPPFIGEHTEEVRAEWARTPIAPERVYRGLRSALPAVRHRGKAFPLSDIRVIDLGWMLASAGAGRFLTALGAEVIKVEHDSRPDGMRFGRGNLPVGGRVARDSASEPLVASSSEGMDGSGSFMTINSGKLSLSLNLKTPQGKEVLEELIRDADVIMEGYSPGAFERMGFSYERLRELNPALVYVQQSGFGSAGSYGQLRAYGPTAQAITGISEMSGLPEPFPPAGIGYSFLDWHGAYNMATAILAGLYRRDVTGIGCHVDASQAETGIYLTGSAILDHSVNGRSWSRYGNRSPYKQAAPCGVYRTEGADRWIAVSTFNDHQWDELIRELGSPAWAEDSRFATMHARYEHQDVLDQYVQESTRDRDGVELMAALQARGVPAGICQTAEDRIDHDPQLRHLEWLVELDQATMGRWPMIDFPVSMSESAAYAGGRFDRSGPSYAQDTDYVLKRLLGKSDDEVEALRDAGVL